MLPEWTRGRVHRCRFCGEAESVRNLEVEVEEGEKGNIFQKERVAKICVKTENVAGDFQIADD